MNCRRDKKREPKRVFKCFQVIGGSTVASGSLTMRATATGAESVLGTMIALVERAQSTKAPIARLADSIAARFVPAILLFALFDQEMQVIFSLYLMLVVVEFIIHTKMV